VSLLRCRRSVSVTTDAPPVGRRHGASQGSATQSTRAAELLPRRPSTPRSTSGVVDGQRHVNMASRPWIARHNPPLTCSFSVGLTGFEPATPLTPSHIQGVRQGSRKCCSRRSADRGVRRRPVRFATVPSALLYRLLYCSPAPGRVGRAGCWPGSRLSALIITNGLRAAASSPTDGHCTPSRRVGHPEEPHRALRRISRVPAVANPRQPDPTRIPIVRHDNPLRG
jgi:hypothetical protein